MATRSAISLPPQIRTGQVRRPHSKIGIQGVCETTSNQFRHEMQKNTTFNLTKQPSALFISFKSKLFWMPVCFKSSE